jgi:hypothetical protein
MTTCQICGRAIKANTGLIAHHGYKRPYEQHYQTRSCFGARYAPYEVAHDALDAYEPLLIGWLDDARRRLREWMDSPPDTIVFQPRNAYGPRGEPVTLTRPESFDAARNLAQGAYRSRTYECEHSHLARQYQQNVGGLTDDLKFVRERRAAWKAAA